MPSNGTALIQQPVLISKILSGERGELWLKPRSSAWEAEAYTTYQPPIGAPCSLFWVYYLLVSSISLFTFVIRAFDLHLTDFVRGDIKQVLCKYDKVS